MSRAQMEHTPGPWGYETDLEEGDIPRPWVGRLEENRYTALSCGETREEATANARLIAAAPELLAALILLEKRCGPLAEDGKIARAAIARATGAA